MSTRRQRSLTLILKELRSVGNNFPSFLPDVSHFFFIPAVGFRMTSSTCSYRSLHELCNLPSFTLLLTCALFFSQVFSIPQLNCAGLNHVQESQVLEAKASLSGICGHMCPGLSPVFYRQLSPAQFSEDLLFLFPPPPLVSRLNRGAKGRRCAPKSVF